MRILLDTHLLLWWLADSPELSASARQLISDRDNTIFLSAVCLWEIWLKVSLGKLRVPDDFDAKISYESFESLPLTAAHARQIGSLPWHHRDPFDRMLVVQAKTEGLTLLTADDHLVQYGNFVRIAR